MEIWEDIKGYEGLYQVSNLGKVRGLEKTEYFTHYKTNKITKRIRKENILKLQKQKNGYIRCCLSKNHIKKYYWVHRLVAQAFIPNPKNLPCVNHKDENPRNNNANNLEWCTEKYNCNYGTSIERQVAKRKRKVVQYDTQGNVIKIWQGLADVEKELGLYRGNIYKCCNNQRAKTGGYMWKYLEGEM